MMAEMEGDKTVNTQRGCRKRLKEVKEAVEAKFNLETEEVVAENTIGKTAAEKKACRAGWLAWHKRTAAEMRAFCEDKDPWHLCGQICKDLRDAKKRALDAEVEKSQDEAFAIKRAKKKPPPNDTVPHSQMVLAIQGNCSSSSSGVLCGEECARDASG